MNAVRTAIEASRRQPATRCQGRGRALAPGPHTLPLVKHLWVVFVLACGCGNGGDKGQPAMPDAAGVTPDGTIAIDSGGFVEGVHPTQPVVMSQGGPVLAAPEVVPIFFQGDDTMQAYIEGFLPQLAASPYWPAIANEYGVSTMTIAPSIVSTDAPPATDDALQTWLQANVGVTPWPANNANTIYAVFLPGGAFTASFGTACTDYGGFHEEFNGIVYALLPRCTSATLAMVDYLTVVISHELMEASTDPFPYSAPAFNDVDDDDTIWNLTPGGELGDMCEYADGARQRLVGSYMVQRMWSNNSAAAGHDPCVPELPGGYIEATTALADITLDLGGEFSTRGVSVPMSMSKTVDVALYSDEPAPDWTVAAIDVASHYHNTLPELQLSLDATTGNNSTTLHLTITRLHAGSLIGGLSELELVSQVNGVTVGMWWTLVAP